MRVLIIMEVSIHARWHIHGDALLYVSEGSSFHWSVASRDRLPGGFSDRSRARKPMQWTRIQYVSLHLSYSNSLRVLACPRREPTGTSASEQS